MALPVSHTVASVFDADPSPSTLPMVFETASADVSVGRDERSPSLRRGTPFP
ncbi:MAG: hypothetical protein Q9169_007427 [Polycauliona sp. 2 TL-2023]